MHMYVTVSECFNTIKFEDIKGLKYKKVWRYQRAKIQQSLKISKGLNTTKFEDIKGVKYNKVWSYQRAKIQQSLKISKG